MKLPRCPKCKSVLADDGSCWRCSFVPKVGKLAATKDQVDMEDDYGDESDADSTCFQRSEVQERNQ